MLHAKVRELLVSFVRNNANKFRVYVTEGSLEDHLLNMQYRRTWGTQVELYAAASLFQKEIYVFTPTLRKDGRYTWIKIPPYPPHVELIFPPQDEPWPRLLDEIDHMELCHTFGNHYDVVQSTDGLCSLLKPTLGLEYEILEFQIIIVLSIFCIYDLL